MKPKNYKKGVNLLCHLQQVLRNFFKQKLVINLMPSPKRTSFTISFFKGYDSV